MHAGPQTSPSPTTPAVPQPQVTNPVVGGNAATGNTASTAAAEYTASGGVAQKVPLIKGSGVTVQELSKTLSPTGKQYSFQINSDLGTFETNTKFTSQ